jgi:3-hydroxy-9,10-secoandrosta-1,3,5(10)-triene-9,17-dione monooxygenase reductase component
MNPAPIDPLLLRRSLGSFVTGVTIMTTCTAGGELVGLTVNSFNAVSLSPPLVLWSLSLRAASYDAFMQASHFAVNVLAADQRALSDRFARTGGDKFNGLSWREGMNGLPLFEGTAASFICRNTARHPGGDHVIFIGEVLAHESSARPPLVYANGRYATVFEGSQADLAREREVNS